MRYLILILILFCNTLLHSQWVQQSSGSSQLICVSAPNDTIVWASGTYTGAGGGSIVLRTTNGGIKWEQVAILNTYPGAGAVIAGIDENKAVLCYDTTAYRTTNGGLNWDVVLTQRSGFFNAIDIQPNGHGIIQGDPVNAKWSIWKTTNYGINWTKINTLNAWNTDASSFNSLYIRGQTIYFCGIGGKIFFSSSSGSNWTQQSVSLSWPIAIWFNNDSVGMVGSGLGKTTNGGVNWTTQSAPGSGTIRGIAGYGENWWYVRRYKTIHRSTNNGLTWTTDSTSQELWDIAISKTGTSLWAVGEFGSIYSNNGTITNVISNSIPLSIFLNQNYPNPFNPSTKIKFNILKNSFVELTVFDSSGRLIKKLLNESLQAGTYESVFDGSGIPSGVYFYTLKTNEFTETKKMILLK